MKNILLSNIKYGLFSKQFLFCSLFIPPIIFVSSLGSLFTIFRNGVLLQYDYHSFFILEALSTNTIIFFVPIISVLPMGSSFIEDIKNNYTKYYIFRSKRFPYILGRSLGVYVSGGLSLLSGILIAYFLAALLFMPIEKAPDMPSDLSSGFRQVLSSGMLFFLSGGFWALVGLSLSTFMESKYISYASPFISFYLLMIVHERYLNYLFIINPKEWLIPSKKWLFGEVGVVIWVIELSIVVAVIFYWNASRRLNQL